MNSKGLLHLVFIIIVGTISVSLEKPTYVKPRDVEGFSALNAKVHLDTMASEIHFMGTAENRKVKDYILSEFDKLGIPTETFIGRSNSAWSESYIRMSRTENIIATLKGQNSSKALVLCAHYDSVLDGPGAADDVHAVACILEVAKLLKDKKLNNDIIFLITDGEEMGLLGAKAFTEEKDLSQIGLILNYEARGNSGPSISFEWSDDNGWLVRQLKEVGHRPIANSMSYEIYKLLPNDTDYSYFKKEGIAGINHAFIDGFSYYHNPDDTPEKINLKSVQHTGENMFLLAHHFANEDLTDVKSENASFFNFFGSLIIYPSSWDIMIMIVCFILFLMCIFFAKRNKIIFIKDFAISTASLLALLILNAAVAYGLGLLMLKLYPNYNLFYSGQYYNHTYYFIALSGLNLLISWVIISWINKHQGKHAIRLGILFILLILMLLVYYIMPTAVYFISLTSLCLGLFSLLEYKTKNEINPPTEALFSIARSLFPIAVWIPMSYMFFLAFSLKLLSGPAIVFTLIAFACFTAQSKLWEFKNKILPLLGISVFLISLVTAHFKSKPSKEFPIPSSLIYHFDQKDKLAHWMTYDEHINIGNETFLESPELKNLSLMNSNKVWTKETNIASHIQPMEIIHDSLSSSFFAVRKSEAFQTRLLFEDTKNIRQIIVNNKSAFEQRRGSNKLVIDLLGLTSDTLQIKIEKEDKNVINEMSMNTRFKSFPVEDQIPAGAKRTDGYTSIVQHIKI